MKPGLRFLRHGGIYRSDAGSQIVKCWGRSAASRWSAPGPAKGRDGRNAPCSSSAMSSGRLFLDRGARQQSPSPLHRQPHPKTVPGWGTMNLQRTANSVLTLCLSQGDNRIRRAARGQTSRREAPQRFCRSRSRGSNQGSPRRYVSGGLHGAICWTSIRVACVSEEIENGPGDTAPGHRTDQATSTRG
jgi:hypothetical protein